MKRLLSLLGLLLAFALPSHAQTKTDSIKFKVSRVGYSATLKYEFSEQVRDGIEIEWVSSNGTESGKFRPDADGNCTRTITGSGTGYIYYTYEQGSTYSAYLSYADYDHYFYSYDISVITGQPIITSLDVSACPALMDLNCRHNQWTSLDVSRCTALTKLDCSYNRLTALDVSQNTALTRLDCNGNQLTSLDLSKNTALTVLWCNGNQLTSLDVSGCISLPSLDCSDMQLTSLDVSGCTALKDLYCQNNQLTSLDVSDCTALTRLSCYNNQLTALNVSAALTGLYCYNNQLTGLDVSGCTALTTLYCYSNQLTSLDVSNNTALTSLACRDNQLTSLNVSGCTALWELNFENNQLTSLDVSGCISLPRLDCSNMQLTSLDVSGCTALTTLRCYSNQLTSLDVSGCTALTYLECRYNQLTSLDVSGCISLPSLDCSNMQLTSLDVSGCTALKDLYCPNNQLTSLDVSGCTALTRLSCLKNQLTSLDVSKNTKLEGLACYNNQLTSLDVSKNTALTSLDCRYNQLTSLDVSKNTALTDLRCSENQLTSLDVSKNTALASLRCESNHIPLSDLHKAYIQNSNWNWFSAYGQSDTLTLPVNQVLDLSSERLLGESLSTFEITPDAYTENNFTFQFKKVQPYTLTIENSGIRNHMPYNDQLDGTALTFTYYISVIEEVPVDYYTVSLASNDSAWGSVSQSGNGTYKVGDSVTIIATPKNGYRFDKWTKGDTVFSREAKYTFEVTENLELTAHFEVVSHTVILSSNNAEWGLASLIGNGTYKLGDSVTVIATPKEGYRFVNWTKGGEVFSTETVYTFEVRESIELAANFEEIPAAPITFTVSLSSNNPEWGIASLIGYGIYKVGDSVTVIATPKTGYRFVNWTKDGAEFSTEAIYTFIVTEDLELTAHFEKIQEEPEEADGFTLSLFADNPEQGYVFRSGNNCTYEEGEEVMILALPKEGYRFDKWTKGDAVFSKEALHTLFVTEDMELTAYFEKLPDDVAIGTPKEDDFHVYVLDRNIILSENRGLVQVFNAIGQCVYSGNATIIPVRQSGVYVVRVGANSHKVIVR